MRYVARDGRRDAGLPARQPRCLDEVQRALHRRARRRGVGSGRDRLGRLANARVRREGPARPAGQGCRRAWVWHGVRRRLAEAPWRAAGRRRRHHAGAARDRPAVESQVRDGTRAHRGERGGRAPARRGFRSRHLGIWRIYLVRSGQVDPGGSTVTPTRRRACVPAQFDPLDALYARCRQGPGDATAPAAGHESARVDRG